ncbi:MAG: HlyD family efflux transporter periplasmic adaptor subunit [Pirellulales bacterium]
MMSKQPIHRQVSNRRGRVAWGWLLGLACAPMLAFATWQMLPDRSEAGTGPISVPVERGVFVFEVTERGEVESSNNVEVRCDVKSRSTTGMVIKKLIAEGAMVQPGDVVCEFDDSALQDELIQQQIMCNNSRALVTQAEYALKTAETSLEEYQEGTFKQEVELVQSEIALAEENVRRARQYLQHSKKLAAKGYITPLQLKADDFAVNKAEGELKAARTKLDVAQRFTFRKMVDQLTADLETAKVKLESEQKSHELDERKREWIEEQIENCIVKAPVEGQVVYANPSSSRGNNNEPLIQEGTAIRERQAIIRLPDPTKMQVKAKINESRIDLIKSGMKATVRLDAFPDIPLSGVVTKVDDYPLSANWFSSSVKEYGTNVKIDNPPPGMRAGMTAAVQIHVEQLPDVVQAPVHAVIENGKQHFCLVTKEGVRSLREIEIGSSNDKFLVVKGGLEPGEKIVLNPRAHLGNLKLPEIPVEAARPAEQFARVDVEGGATASDGEEKPRRGKRPGGGNAAGIAASILQNADKDGDGKISEDEAPDRMKANFAQTDANKDGFIDVQEMAAGLAKAMAAGAGATPPGESGAGGGGGQ